MLARYYFGVSQPVLQQRAPGLANPRASQRTFVTVPSVDMSMEGGPAPICRLFSLLLNPSGGRGPKWRNICPAGLSAGTRLWQSHRGGEAVWAGVVEGSCSQAKRGWLWRLLLLEWPLIGLPRKAPRAASSVEVKLLAIQRPGGKQAGPWGRGGKWRGLCGKNQRGRKKKKERVKRKVAGGGGGWRQWGRQKTKVGEGRLGGRGRRRKVRRNQKGGKQARKDVLPSHLRVCWLSSPPSSAERQPRPFWLVLAFSGLIASTRSSNALVRQPLGRTRQEPQMPPTPRPLSQLMLLF